MLLKGASLSLKEVEFGLCQPSVVVVEAILLQQLFRHITINKDLVNCFRTQILIEVDFLLTMFILDVFVRIHPITLYRHSNQNIGRLHLGDASDASMTLKHVNMSVTSADIVFDL
jgi:hypothetical protein